MKFRKKPVVIEAERYWPDEKLWPEGVEELPEGSRSYWPDHTAQILTLEGPHMVSPGDWIITGVKGERYACKPDIFDMTYEPVERELSEAEVSQIAGALYAHTTKIVQGSK